MSVPNIRPPMILQVVPTLGRCRRETSRQRFFRNMRRNRIWLFVFLYVSVLLPELTLRATSCRDSASFWEPELGLLLLYGLEIALGLFLLCTWIPSRRLSRWVCICSVALFWGLCSMELLYYQVLGCFFSPGSVFSGQLLQAMPSLFSQIPRAFPGIFLMGLPLAWLLCGGHRGFSFRPLRNPRDHIPTAVFLGAIHLLGMVAAFQLNPVHSFLGQHAPQEVITVAPIPPETTPPSGNPASPQTPDSQDANVLNIDFQTLAGQEAHPGIAQIHRYFAARSPSMQNPKTGLFRGCNLILISADAFEPSSLSPESTPALCRLKEEGFFFSDFHTPRWDADAALGEFALLTGMLPTVTAAQTSDLFLPFSLPQRLLQAGYTAYGCHCHGNAPCSGTRHLEALGYQCFGCTRSSPGEFIDGALNRCTAHTPFTAFWTLSDYEDPTELDRTMALVLSRLESSGILNDTVIVLFSGQAEDHAGSSPTGGCFIWKSGMTPEIVPDPTSPLDLLPTLCNLMGLPFDSRVCMGRDVFSDGLPLVIFPDRSWLASDSASCPDARTLRTEIDSRFAVCAGIAVWDYWKQFPESSFEACR